MKPKKVTDQLINSHNLNQQQATPPDMQPKTMPPPLYDDQIIFHPFPEMLDNRIFTN